jgi:hypothetical protein
MPTVRELRSAETALAWNAQRDLRPHVTSPEDLESLVNGAQRAE